jgi:hypothetical protein
MACVVLSQAQSITEQERTMSSKLTTLLLSGLLLAGPVVAGEREGGRPGPDVIGEEISLDLVRASAGFTGQAGLAAMRLEDERRELVWETGSTSRGRLHRPALLESQLPPGAFLGAQPRRHRSVTYRASDLVAVRTASGVLTSTVNRPSCSSTR